MIYILKNPSIDTLAIIADAPDSRQGWEQMSEDDARSWVESQSPTESQSVPQSIPLYKLKLWLINAGFLKIVEAIISDDTQWPSEADWLAAKTLWNHRPEVMRSSQLVNQLGTVLGMTQAQIDAAFIASNSLE